MNNESTVTIERWHNAYCVAADHPAPEELRSRLDRLVASEVVDACRRRLGALLDESDPSVWLIRAIQVDLALDASPFVAQQAGGAWGEQLAIRVQRVLDGGPGDGPVIRFADRVAYLAQWARDMAAGCAWEKWYYAEFDSLRSLPQSAAIAEGMVREPKNAQRILLSLHAQRGLEAVLDVLTNADVKRIYASALPRTQGFASASGRWITRLLTLWNGIALSMSGNTSRDALRLLVAAKTEWPGHDDDLSGLRYAIDGLLELRRVLSAFASPELALRFLQAAVAHKYEAAQQILAACHLVVDDDLLGFVSSASGGDQTWVGLASSVVGPSNSSDASREESFLCELGGIFLLGPAFIDLNVDEALRDAAQSCEEPLRVEQVLRHHLALRCMGWPRASLAISDPAIALFAHAQRNPSLSEMADTLESADVGAALRIVAERMMEHAGEGPEDGSLDEHLDYFAVGRVFPELQLDADRDVAWSRIGAAVLRNFARRLPGFGRSSPEYLFQNFLAGTSSVRVGTSRIEVRLAQSPLVVVLRIAGSYRLLTLPWHEGVEICLLAPAE